MESFKSSATEAAVSALGIRPKALQHARITAGDGSWRNQANANPKSATYSASVASHSLLCTLAYELWKTILDEKPSWMGV